MVSPESLKKQSVSKDIAGACHRVRGHHLWGSWRRRFCRGSAGCYRRRHCRPVIYQPVRLHATKLQYSAGIMVFSSSRVKLNTQPDG